MELSSRFEQSGFIGFDIDRCDSAQAVHRQGASLHLFYKKIPNLGGIRVAVASDAGNQGFGPQDETFCWKIHQAVIHDDKGGAATPMFRRSVEKIFRNGLLKYG